MEEYRRPGMSRRDFIRTNALGIAMLPAMNIGLGTAFAQNARTQVVLVVTQDRRQGVTTVMNTLGYPAMKGARVRIKPNFNTADPCPGGTHNDTLSQLIAEIRNRGGEDITITESSGPPQTRGVLEQKGVIQLASEMKTNIINFEDLAEDQWVPCKGDNWANGFSIPRVVSEAEYIVSTCCLKTHSQGVFTMSLKLGVGLTPKALRGDLHGFAMGGGARGARPGGPGGPGGPGQMPPAPTGAQPGQMPPGGPGAGGPGAGVGRPGGGFSMLGSPEFHKRIAEINTAYKPQLIVMDGIECFTDGGPMTGTRKTGNVFIGGTDRIAVDAVGVAILKELGSNDNIMGKKIFEQNQIARAIELNLGIRSPEQIEIVTPDQPSAAYAEKIRAILAQG